MSKMLAERKSAVVEGEVGRATFSNGLLGTNQEGYSGAFSEYTISLTCEWWKEVTHPKVQPTALIYSLQQATHCPGRLLVHIKQTCSSTHNDRSFDLDIRKRPYIDLARECRIS